MALSLWDYAVEAYGREGVKDLCLQLQDDHGLDVPLLLWAAWVVQTGLGFDADLAEAGADQAEAWRTAAVLPLRAVRRRLKLPSPDLTPGDRNHVRDLVKAAELAAERALLSALEVLTHEEAKPAKGAITPSRLLEALILVARQQVQALPRPSLERLASALLVIP